MAIKLYPSSSAFARGFTVFTKFNSGCLRKILLNAHGIREELKTDTQALGLANENAYEAHLKATLPCTASYTREERLVRELDDTGTVIFSGRVDFILRNLPHTKVIELKSTRSVNKRRELRQGVVSPENVAQLIAYMVELEADVGDLIYTFYDEKKSTKENFVFAVSIESDGSIRINGLIYEFSVHDYLRHRELAARTLLTDTIGSRPNNATKPFDSPCHFCPFKARCEKADRGCSVSEFVQPGPP